MLISFEEEFVEFKDAPPTEPTPQNYPPGRTILVSPLLPSVGEKTLTDFFSFCGPIESVSLFAKSGPSQSSFVVFSSSVAAQTAALLSPAIIGGAQVTVVIVTAGATSPSIEAGSGPGSPVSQRAAEGGAGPSEPGRVARVLASAHGLAERAAGTVAGIDQRLRISASVATTVQRTGISSGWSKLMGVMDKGGKKVSKVLDKGVSIVSTAGKKVASTAPMQTVIKPFKALSGKVDSTVGEIMNQSAEVIDERRREGREREAMAPTPSTDLLILEPQTVEMHDLVAVRDDDDGDEDYSPGAHRAYIPPETSISLATGTEFVIEGSDEER